MTKDTTNKKSRPGIIITAGASGIGRCMAETFLSEGYAVHICDIDQSNIDDFLVSNPQATASFADVSQPQQVALLFEEYCSNYPQLNVLINNAGIAGPTALVEDTAVDDWDNTIGVNLNGMFYVTRMAVPLLKKAGGGSIINMSSTAGLLGVHMRSSYAASKWGVIGLTKTWAMELGPHKIRVNALCPGCVSGDRIENVITAHAKERDIEAERIREVYLRQSSLRQFVDSKNVADMASYLCSDKGEVISGQAIAVDGHTEGLLNWLD